MKTKEAMEKEEAVRRIDFIEQCECNERDRMALNMGADALKKQIPMKPIKDEFRDYHCQDCGEELGYESYCHNCGQAIDWSNEDV